MKKSFLALIAIGTLSSTAFAGIEFPEELIANAEQMLGSESLFSSRALQEDILRAKGAGLERQIVDDTAFDYTRKAALRTNTQGRTGTLNAVIVAPTRKVSQFSFDVPETDSPVSNFRLNVSASTRGNQANIGVSRDLQTPAGEFTVHYGFRSTKNLKLQVRC